MEQAAAAAHEKRLARARREWRTWRPVASSLPVHFASGCEIKKLDCHCTRCGRPIAQSNLKGRLVRSTPEVVSFEAWGACFDCMLLSPFAFRVRSEGGIRLEWRDPDLGWVYSHSRARGGFIGALIRKLRRALGLTRKRETAGLRRALEEAAQDYAPNDVVRDVASDADRARRTVMHMLASHWLDTMDAELAGRGVRRLRPLATLWSAPLFDTEDGDLVRIATITDRSAERAGQGPLASGELGPWRWEVWPPDLDIDALAIDTADAA